MDIKNGRTLYNYEFCYKCQKPYTLSGYAIQKRKACGNTLLLCAKW